MVLNDDQTLLSPRSSPRGPSAGWTGVALLLLAICPADTASAQASRAASEAANSAIQSAIQSARDQVWWRIHRFRGARYYTQQAWPRWTRMSWKSR